MQLLFFTIAQVSCLFFGLGNFGPFFGTNFGQSPIQPVPTLTISPLFQQQYLFMPTPSSSSASQTSETSNPQPSSTDPDPPQTSDPTPAPSAGGPTVIVQQNVGYPGNNFGQGRSGNFIFGFRRQQ
ncbi:hypothetical protein DSO57_1014131 [Entomophthora muscae]|uniref:Uncharacterized protein n=1 Tax=Entomophthora muscae TaxID=34485 RepID=A0ACC2RK45_9FUNG|nr:hypothetical protein DSO57_1014131 [Entomophthora muscae]